MSKLLRDLAGHESDAASQSGGAAGRISRRASVAMPATEGTGGADPTAGLLPEEPPDGVKPDAAEKVAAIGSGGGEGLPAELRGSFEESLGIGLGGVRVHTDGASAEAADALGARAFARGSDVHFGAGQYRPDDPFGQHLLAHEVAHTVQQGGAPAGVQEKLEVSSPADPAEHEADHAADAMVAGKSASVTPLGGAIARKVMRGPPVGPPGTPIGDDIGHKDTWKIATEAKLNVPLGALKLSSVSISGEVSQETAAANAKPGSPSSVKVGGAGETKGGKNAVGVQAEYEEKTKNSIVSLFTDSVKFKCKVTSKGFEVGLELKKDLPEWTGLSHKLSLVAGKDWDKGGWTVDDILALKWGLENKKPYKLPLADPALFFKGGVEVKISVDWAKVAQMLAEQLGAEALVALGGATAMMSVPAAIMLGLSASLSEGERDKKLISSSKDAYHASMAYATIMSGGDTSFLGLGGGPSQLRAESLAKADLARLAATKGEGVPIEAVKAELKGQKDAFGTLWQQSRTAAFSELLNKTDAYIKEWRSDHYIVSAFKSEFTDQAHARKLITDFFSK